MDVLSALDWSTVVFFFSSIFLGISFLVFLGLQFDKEQERKSTIGIKDEPSDEQLEFKNLPNFRQAGGTGLMNKHGRKIKDGYLYRSSRTDFLSEDEMDQIKQLGIKSIIDLRRNKEYIKADGDKILDQTYKIYVMKDGKIKDWKPKKKKRQQENVSSASVNGLEYCGKRYLINLITIPLIKYVFGRVNIFMKALSLSLLAVDELFGSHLFVRLLSHLVSNRHTLAEEYMNLVEYTKPELVATLRLLLEESNVPVLIHCAHGKDRTGVVVALILGCLEVEDKVIADDYAKSEAGLAPIKERLYRETVGRYGFKAEFTRATADTMRTVLDRIRERYGSVPEYLETAGFTSEEQQKLKDMFLE